MRRIQERYSTLRPAERIVADFLRDHANERLDASITEFAQKLGVSESTISRVSRSLGYGGYPDMKLTVASSMRPTRALANIPSDVRDSDPLIEMTRKLANVFAETLLGTQKRLDAVAVERAVEVLGNASKVVFVGVGGAAPICDEAAHMLLKMGKDTVSHRDGYTQAIVAANLGPGTAMVGVSHTGSTATVAQALALARHNGADTIAITSDPKSQVALAAEIVLQTWHHTALQIPLYGDFLEGRIGQLFLVDVIYLGLLFRSGQKARERLETTTAALKGFSITQRRAPSHAGGGGGMRPASAANRRPKG